MQCVMNTDIYGVKEIPMNDNPRIRQNPKQPKSRKTNIEKRHHAMPHQENDRMSLNYSHEAPWDCTI